MHRRAGLLVAVLMAGCAADPGDAAGPSGWSRDACDAAAPSFTTGWQPRSTFVRDGNDSAARAASRVVEAVGDGLQSPMEPWDGDAAGATNDVHAWQTRLGTVRTYWTLDPAAWTIEHVATFGGPEESPYGRNQTALAVLGSLGIPANDVELAAEGPGVQAWRLVGGARAPLLAVEDLPMQAEQSSMVRRQVVAEPDYEGTGAALLGLDEGTRRAQAVLDCHAAGVWRADTESARFVVVDGHPGYRIQPLPAGPWPGSCGPGDAGLLHVTVDAGTGTVLSRALDCPT